MMVSRWGPPGWKYLHSVAHGYPESPSEYDAQKYKIFFTAVGKTLPCRLCRESYVNFVTENPVRTGSRQELTRWLWEIHNKVNDKLGRTYKTSDFDSTTKYYESFRAKCSNTPNSKGCTDALHPVKSLASSLCVYCIPLKSLLVLFTISALVFVVASRMS